MIRRLDPDSDLELYRQRWAWRESYPRSFREATTVDSVGSFEEFVEQARGARADIGIFDGGLIACIALQWKAEGVYEIHESVKRGVKLEQLIEPCLSIQKTIFEDLQARFIFAFTPEWNRRTILLATMIGLEVDGVRRIKGIAGGTLITWIRLSQSRANYVRDTTADADANRDGAVLPAGELNHHYDASSEYARHRAAA